MISLPGGSLVNYLNPWLQKDPVSVTLAQTLDADFAAIIAQLPLANIFSNLPNQPESVLDFVAVYCLNVDFYDYSLPYDNKLYLVQNAILFKMIKGTKACLERVISNVYAYGQVIQWFEPGFNADGTPGVPYTFRIQLGADISDPVLLAKITALMLAYKNVRSLCVSLEPLQFGNTVNYTGCAISTYKKYVAWAGP